MSEFSEIQPASQGGRLSGPISVESGRDLAAGFTKAGNAGQKVELFFTLAEGHPQVAVPAFTEILVTTASAPMRALALQGLGKIIHPQVKRVLAEDLDVLKDIAKEVKGKGKVSSDLTRWAAAWAIEWIGFPQEEIEHIEGGALTDPLPRIRKEIINRKLQEIDKIQRCYSTGTWTAEYERHLEFWLYGPTEELFRANSNTRNYQEIVVDVIYELHVRGVQLGVDSQNRSIQEAALRIAKQIFLEPESTEADQRRLYEYLKPFLSNEYNRAIPLRKLAAEAICKAGSWLPLSLRVRVLVICEQWQQVEAMGESAISQLEEVIDRKLLLATSESDISDQQIKAVEAISKIQFADFSQKLGVLAKVLLRPEEAVRNAAARLLNLHNLELAKIDIDAANLLTALLRFDLNGPDPTDLTVEQMEGTIRLARQKQSETSDIFSRGSAGAHSLGMRYAYNSSVVQEFLQRKRDEYLSNLESRLQIKLNSLKFDTLPEQPLADLTVSKMEYEIRELERRQSEIVALFSAAITTLESYPSYDSGNSGLKEIMENKLNGYLSNVKACIEKLNNQIAGIKEAQNKIEEYQKRLLHNQYLLNGAFSDVSSLDSKLSVSDRIEYLKKSLPNQGAINSSDFQTYNQCQSRLYQCEQMSRDLTSIKYDLLYELKGRISELNWECETSKSRAQSAIKTGLFIIVFTFLIGLLLSNSVFKKNQGQTFRSNISYKGWGFSSKSSSTSKIPWYATGFPKPNGCGSSASPNNCWYPVFVKYSDYNWSRVRANHCGDIEVGQSQETARKQGKIQIASFNNTEEAKGFADYMKGQYGSGWVGIKKCF